MKLGMHCNRFTWEGGPARMGATLKGIGQRLEAAGFYSMSVMDHYFQIAGVGAPELDMNEAYTTLGFVAGATERLRLGTIVTGVTYREPAFLVKQVTTLDVLSGGRAWFGIGAAWYEREHLGLGFNFPPVAERFRRLEETLQIANQMWSGEVKPYEGRYYQLAETLCSPQPLQKPHPPIMIGGGGEQKTLKLVARYADACNIGGEPEVIKHKLEVLRKHCEAEGRDYDTIEKTTNTNLTLGKESPADVIARLKQLSDLGITWVNGRIANADEPGSIEQLGREVIPAARDLP